MAFQDPALAAEEPDFGRSIPFRFDCALSDHYTPLLDWLTGQVLSFHHLDAARLRPKPFQQIIDAIDCLLANFLEAHRINPDCFVAISMAENSFTLAYLEVFSMIFAEYQLRLGSNGEIDFNDMIIEATDHVEASRYQNPYSYICVDEFQDISRSRARLLKALLQQSPSNQLFAVGDDWQAIYRFA